MTNQEAVDRAGRFFESVPASKDMRDIEGKILADEVRRLRAALDEAGKMSTCLQDQVAELRKRLDAFEVTEVRYLDETHDLAEERDAAIRENERLRAALTEIKIDAGIDSHLNAEKYRAMAEEALASREERRD